MAILHADRYGLERLDGPLAERFRVRELEPQLEVLYVRLESDVGFQESKDA